MTKKPRKDNTEAGEKASSELNMLPRALIGDIKPENWLGFIDAIYAIILTLLLIELPTQIMDIIKEYEHHTNLRSILINSFALSIIGYLALFMLIYDIWAHHRVVVTEAALNRVNLSLGILILFMCSLMPPLYHVVSALKHEYITRGDFAERDYSFIYMDARIATYLVVICVYGCIAIIAAKDLRFFRRRGDEAAPRMLALKRLKDSSISMLLTIAVVSFITSISHIAPPYPLVLVALCTHLPVDRIMGRLKRRIFG